jgi:hypothetical protein
VRRERPQILQCIISQTPVDFISDAVYLLSHRACCCGYLRLDYGRSPHAYVNQRLQIQLEHLMMSGMPLETCWALNEYVQ